MEKRGLIIIFAIMLISSVSALCDLNVILLNQDPYPAVQGDYVKLVFQLQGVQSSACGEVSFSFIPEYPFSLDPGANITTKITGGTFTTDYNSFLMVPYKVRVDEGAVDGNNTVRVRYSTGTSEIGSIVKNFSVEVKELKTDFEIFVKDYNPTTNTLTLEILNSGKNDVEGVTLEIPEQANVKVKGPNYKIIGSLDSNDFTTATYEAVPSKGEISLKIYYTDSTFKRRNISKTVSFNPDNFTDRNVNKKNYSWVYILIIVVVIIGIWYYFYRKKQKEKRKKLFS